ncbi:MAG: hypothetical protein MK116_13170 [Phycisphaerales bacterium]|nr:hypothetical protein [Phycisphaerales bacterium]
MSTLGLIITSLVLSQNTAAPPLEQCYVINSENAVVRCGADRNFYAFLDAPSGSVVRVTEELANWGRVPAEGPLFDESWGWIRHPVDERGRFQVVDTQSGKTLDTMPVYAPDLADPDPTKAWRPISMLPMDTPVTIIDATTADVDGQPHRFYRVRLTDRAEGWINMADLRPATAQEAARWTGQPSTPTRTTTPTPTAVSEPIPTETETVQAKTPAAGQPSYLARYLAARRNRLAAAEPIEMIEVTETPEVVEVATASPDRTPEQRYFDGLEQIYNSLPATDMSEDLATRLWEAYAVVAELDQDTDPESAQLAMIRMRQLELASCLREEQRLLNRLDAVVQVAAEDASAMRTVLDAPMDYTVLGRLNVSSIFTGTDERPMMYRIEDPNNGRTLVYVQPMASVDLGEMIGQWIGVVGNTTFDNRWQVQVIDPKRVDLVAAAH